jgi:hypothetical protein
MRDRYRWLGLVMSLVLSVPALAMGNEPIGPRQVVEGTVRFDLYWGYLIVAHGSSGPLRGLTFVVDTGASPTVLDPRIARKLHLEGQSTETRVLGGSVQAQTAMLPSLSFGPIERTNVPVLIQDLSFLEKALPLRVDGMIGLDVLGQSAFVIDYASREIRFGPSPALPNPIPLRMKDGLAIIDARVNGVAASLLLDTGAPSLILFAGGATGPVEDRRVSTEQRSPGSIGEVDHKQLRLRSLGVGATEFGQASVSVVSSGGRAGYAFDGLLSPAALGITRVAIDLGRGEVAFSR